MRHDLTLQPPAFSNQVCFDVPLQLKQFKFLLATLLHCHSTTNFSIAVLEALKYKLLMHPVLVVENLVNYVNGFI